MKKKNIQTQKWFDSWKCSECGFSPIDTKIDVCPNCKTDYSIIASPDIPPEAKDKIKVINFKPRKFYPKYHKKERPKKSDKIDSWF